MQQTEPPTGDLGSAGGASRRWSLSHLVRALNQPGTWPLTMPAGTGAPQLTADTGAHSRGRRALGKRRGPTSSSPPTPNPPTHLAVLQEGKKPLQLGHQGLRVVLSQTEHTAPEASNTAGAPGVSQGPQGAPPCPDPRQPRAARLMAE